MIKLTSNQKEALDIHRNVLIEAGAGSGKTTIMIERFFKLLAEDPILDPQYILVITFTKLAAAELKERVQHRLVTGNHPLSPQREQSLLNVLHHLSFSTIDGFCATVLRDMPLLAKIDPHFTVLSAEESALRRDDAIDDTLRQLAHATDTRYRTLLLYYSKSQIKRFLQSLSSSQALALNNNAQQETRYQQALKSSQSDSDTQVTTQSIQWTKALLYINEKVQKLYQQTKNQDGCLDYHDLLSKTNDILMHQDARRYLQQRYAYIFVDEFQDTNTTQWELVQRLCDPFLPFSPKKLCIVGDIKQSIYRFRGAEPYLFKSLLTTSYPDHETRIVHLSDNFRSSPPIIQCINDLFSSLLSTGEHPIPYTPLQSHQREPSNGHTPVMTSFLPPESCLDDECELLTHWIMTQHQSGTNWQDIVVLCRKRAPLIALSQVLSRHNIPTHFHGETDYFQRQFCIDIIALAQSLRHPHDTITVSGLLTSPLFNLTYDDLYVLHHTDNSLYTTLSLLTKQSYPNLWATLEPHDQERIQYAAKTWMSWVDRSCYDPIHTVLIDIIHSYDSYSMDDLSYLIQHIQTIETITPSHAEQWRQFSLLPYQSSRYTQKSASAIGVNLMTIHQSKGLEFHAVAIMNGHGRFNFSKSDSLITTSHGTCLSPAAVDEGVNRLKHDLIQKLQPEIIAEEKRLFYVACTRAISALLLSGIMPKHALNPECPTCFIDFIRMTPGMETLPSFRPSSCINERNQLPLFQTQPDPSPLISEKQVSEKQVSEKQAPSLFKTAFSSTDVPSPVMFSVGDIELILSCPKKYHQRSLLQTLQSHGEESIDAFRMTAIRQGMMHHHSVSYWIRNQCTTGAAINATVDTLSPYKSDPIIQDELHQTLSEFLNYNNQETTLTEWPFTLSIFAVNPSFLYRISGRIDLVSITDDAVTIIDIKTDQVDQKVLDNRVAHYRTQMLLYVMAVSEAHNRPLSKITCQLYFTHCRSWKKIDFKTSDIEDLTSKIQNIDLNKKSSSPATEVCNTCPIYKVNPLCPEG